jgi:hypothetical protein
MSIAGFQSNEFPLEVVWTLLGFSPRPFSQR